MRRRLFPFLLATTAFSSPALADPISLTAAVVGAKIATSATVIAALGGAFGAALLGGVVATGINLLGSRMLMKKPSASQFTQEARGRSLMIRSSVESHKIIYGEARVSGPIVHITTTGEKNEHLWMTLALAGHEVESIDTLYLDDRAVTDDPATGFITGEPYQRTVEAEQTHSIAVASGVRNSALSLHRRAATITTVGAHGFRPTGSSAALPPAPAEVTLSGMADPVWNGRWAVRNVPSFNQLILAINSPVIKQIPPAAFTPVPGGSLTYNATGPVLSSFATVWRHSGGDNQAANGAPMSQIPEWTSDHRLRGIAYISLRFEHNIDVFPNGVPNASAVVRGRKVYDPRTGQTAWSSNPALCIRDYLTAPFGFNCDASEIDDASVIAAANLCDEVVTLASGAQEVRYHCDGVLDTAVSPLENLQQLVSSMAGTVVYVEGRFRCHAGAYESPVGTIDERMLAGEISVRARSPRSELFNAVRGTFIDPERGWQPTDFPPVTNSLYEAQDGGEQIVRDAELPFTILPTTAQRIAKILLEQGRQGITVSMPVKHHALRFSVWDVVAINNEQMGWENKPFRITRWRVEPPGPVILELQEESAASYEWSAEEMAYDPAPDTNLPNASVIDPPSSLTVREELYATRLNDGVKARAVMNWGESPSPFVQEYQPEYRLIGYGTWTILPRTASRTAEINDIEAGAYQFRVKAISYLGVRSPYSETTRNIVGLTAPPQAPQNLTISTIGGLAILRWTPYTGGDSLDVRIGGQIVFRHSPDTTAAWHQSTTISEAVPGSTNLAILPLKPGIYFAKAVNSIGVASAEAASVVTEQATALSFANVTTLTEHSGFPGDKEHCAVNSADRLVLTGEALFSEIVLFSELPSLQLHGGIAPEGTYHFSGGMDFTSKSHVRLTSHVKAAVFNVYDRIGTRAMPISSWTSFTGEASDEADAQVWVRVTDDNPGGSPAWGQWQRCDSMEVHCRAVQAQLRLYAYDAAFNIAVEELKLTADEVT